MDVLDREMKMLFIVVRVEQDEVRVAETLSARAAWSMHLRVADLCGCVVILHVGVEQVHVSSGNVN